MSFLFDYNNHFPFLHNDYCQNSIKYGIDERIYKRLLKRYSNMQYTEELDYCIPKCCDYS